MVPGEGILYEAAQCLMWVLSTGVSSVWWKFLVPRGPVMVQPPRMVMLKLMELMSGNRMPGGGYRY